MVTSDYDSVGGVVGSNLWGVTNNTWYATTDAANNIINTSTEDVDYNRIGTAKTLAEMKQAATYSSLTGKDAVSAVGNGGTTWRIYEGYTTPLLTSLLKGVATVGTAAGVTAEYNGQKQTVDLRKLALEPALSDTSHIYADGAGAEQG